MGYDWADLSSVNGVDHFLRRLEAVGHEVEASWTTLRVCAIAKRPPSVCARPTFMWTLSPYNSRPKGSFDALAIFLGGQENLSGPEFPDPRTAVARDYPALSGRCRGARGRCRCLSHHPAESSERGASKRCLRAARLIAYLHQFLDRQQFLTDVLRRPI